ncbi:uncharacterized protein LOC125016296 [Mugil cephalus]|uniref:uncharacterized protein LOC125016296 n=1 Tax=Mugil cephalus TaxID=48193 RepID=UPI001FB8421F|nr:uncharacterized protein LOC125016296 [Mugil cephalus]
MASTPSASALSAVLRCRGNIWSRNPSSKRPAASAYSLGLSGAALRDSRLGRAGTEQKSLWGSLPLKERVVPGGRLAVVCRRSGSLGGQRLREKDSVEVKKCFPKLSPSRGPRSAGAALHNAPARQLSTHLPATEKYSKMMIKGQTCSDLRVCKVVFVRDSCGPTVFSLKLPGTRVGWREAAAGQIPGFVLSGWLTVRNTCLSLSGLVSRIVAVQLAVMCGDAQRHLLRQEENTGGGPQAHGQTHNSSKDESGRKMEQDRPD